MQVRHLHDTPLVLVGQMWAELVEWARRYMLRPGFELVNPEDMAIPRCVVTADEALAVLREHHARWQLAQSRRTESASVANPSR